MKKSILICGLALVGFTSCKKTWTCECTGTMGGNSSKTTIPDQRKSDAKTACENYENMYKPIYESVSGGGSLTCELK